MRHEGYPCELLTAMRQSARLPHKDHYYKSCDLKQNELRIKKHVINKVYSKLTTVI